MGETTDKLNNILKGTKPERMKSFLDANREDLITDDNPFTKFMRTTIKKKGLVLANVYIAAGLKEKYGQKIIANSRGGEKRDLIIRICLAARFTFEEMQKALTLHNLAPLYAKIPRDAVIISAIRAKKYEISDVDEYLEANGFEKLYEVNSDSDSTD